MKTFWLIALISVIALAAGFVVIQLLPIGKDHTNPPVVREPNWDSPATRELAVRACFDCHSNETVWPWYSNIAPISWMVTNDVQEGRRKLNFSEWGAGEDFDLEDIQEEIAEVIAEGEMPPRQFLLTHPEARLSEAEKQELIQGLLRSMR